MKKKILITLSIVLCVIVIGVFVLAGRGFSASTGLFLRTDNGDMVILDNSPIVMSIRTENDNMFAEYESGDKIFVIHDGIQETYPGGTGVYFSIKLADGHISDISESVLRQLHELGWTTAPVRPEEIYSSENEIVSDGNCENGTSFLPDIFDITYVSSYSMFDDEKIKNASLNADKMNDDGKIHLPVFRFDTKDELVEFFDSFDEKFDSGHSDAEDFRNKLKAFDDDFFKDKMLFVVYFEPRVSSPDYYLAGTYTVDENFRFEFLLKESENKVLTTVSTSAISIIGIEKAFVGGAMDFDAVIVS